MPVVSCPSPELLGVLLTGQLVGDQAEQLEEHLLECDRCAHVAETLSTSDVLLSAARTDGDDWSDDDLLASVVERAKKLVSEAETVDADEETLSLRDVAAISPHLGSADSAKQLAIDFLQPSEREGDFGQLGGHRILGILGVGGMGIVFRAEDGALGRIIALKVLHPAAAGNKAAKERFLREARAAAALDHDNIVTIHQVGEASGVPFIAMQLLRGQSLKSRLEEGRQLEQREVVRIGREVAEGLAAAHRQGLIHRDIKPDNIWLEAETDRVKILDFGLVRSTLEDADLTQTGFVLGTPRYMAPEQAAGDAVDARSDLFSLGSVLYHMATGFVPFKGTTTAILHDLVCKDPDGVESLHDKCDADLANLILQLMAKRPSQRPHSAADVATRLAAIESKLATPQLGRTSMVQPLVTSTLASVPTSKERSKFRYASMVVLALTVLATCWWGVTVMLSVQAEYGTLVVRTTGEDFSTMVQGKKVEIRNTATNETFTIELSKPEESKQLQPGNYTFELSTSGGLKTSTSSFTIASGADSLVEVHIEPQEAQLVAATTSRYALSFDGKDDYVEIPTLKYDGSHPLTMELYATPTGVDDRTQRFVLSNGDYVQQTEKGFSLYERGNSYPQPQFSSWAWGYSAAGGARGSLAGPQEAWKLDKSTHVAAVVDDNKWRFYIGGKLWRHGVLGGAPSASEQPFFIGRHPTLGGYFRGRVDMVRLSKTARYSRNFKPKRRFKADEDTLALYRFESGEGDKLIDFSGNGHDGVIHGATWVSEAGEPVNREGISTSDDGKSEPSVTLFSPGYDEELRELLRKAVEPTPVMFIDSMEQQTATDRSVLMIVSDKESFVQIGKYIPDELRQRKIVGIGYGAAMLFGELGLAINGGACAHGVVGLPRITVQENPLLGRTGFESPMFVFDPPAIEGDKFHNDSFFGVYVGDKEPDRREVMDVIALQSRDSKYAPVVSQNGHVLVCIDAPVNKWSTDLKQLISELVRALDLQEVTASE